ncbi:MAG: hypothetical protein NVS3B8_05790 [Chitinophagaceae bacterium]
MPVYAQQGEKKIPCPAAVTVKKPEAAVQGRERKKHSGGLPGWFKKEKDCFNMFSKAAIIPFTTFTQ